MFPFNKIKYCNTDFSLILRYSGYSSISIINGIFNLMYWKFDNHQFNMDSIPKISLDNLHTNSVTSSYMGSVTCKFCFYKEKCVIY